MGIMEMGRALISIGFDDHFCSRWSSFPVWGVCLARTHGLGLGCRHT